MPSADRYTIFLLLVVVSALTPFIPHASAPDLRWWSAAAVFVAAMVAAGWLGAHRPRDDWINSAAPLLLVPAIYALRCADGNGQSGFAPLILLPAVWFALYGRMRDVLLAAAAGALALVLPIVVVGSPQYPPMSWRGTLLVIVLTAVLGPLIHHLVGTVTRANRALSRSESELRAIFEDAPLGMAITGLHGTDAHRFLRVNRALCELFGRSAAELTSVPITALTHPDDIELSRDFFAGVTDPDIPNRVVKRYLHASGRTVWAAVSYSVVNDEHGRPSHLISQIEDLGAQRESDQALLEAIESDREATERLKQLERVRAEMASTVSHELRTPLTSASGYVELLVEGDAGPLTVEQRNMLDTVARSLARLDGLVDDVLGIATSDQPDRPDPETTDLDDVLRAAVTTVTLQAATRGQDLIVVDELRCAHVAGNPGRLERVLVNLLTNALKFTPEDGTITVTGRRVGDRATISVSDTGVGIARADHERIFERFYRADSPETAHASGTGLGLAIARTITTQYGGELTVESEPGKGATFTLALPLRGDHDLEG